jgi:diaminopimelate epimerase
MNSIIPFTKIHGAGNDFIVINNRKKHIHNRDNSFIRQLCDRHKGIGADGLMLIDYQIPKQFKLTYFNANGEMAEMCGNGARCAVYFTHLVNPDIFDFKFNVGQSLYSGSVTGTNQVRVIWNHSPEYIDLKGLDKIISPEFDRFTFINSGVPHLILLVKSSLDDLDFLKWGPFYRNHSLFQPAGTNVDFIKISDNKLYIRTFERGVESETLSCGTGALAAAAAVANWEYLKLPVEIIAKGGNLKVGLTEKGQYWLEGPVYKVFNGQINRDDF